MHRFPRIAAVPCRVRIRGPSVAILALVAGHEPAPRCEAPSSAAATAAVGATPPDSTSTPSVADVVGVRVQGEAGSYTFAVTVRSPDTGCDRYANWWEVLDSDGALLYRRILGHSHVDEQPFERSGGPVPITADTTVFVRAHLDPGGYGGRVMTGTPGRTFDVATTPPSFPAELEQEAPLPDGCAF